MFGSLSPPAPPCPPISYVETLAPSEAVFGDGFSKEVTKMNKGWSLFLLESLSL